MYLRILFVIQKSHKVCKIDIISTFYHKELFLLYIFFTDIKKLFYDTFIPESHFFCFRYYIFYISCFFLVLIRVKHTFFYKYFTGRNFILFRYIYFGRPELRNFPTTGASIFSNKEIFLRLHQVQRKIPLVPILRLSRIFFCDKKLFSRKQK